MATDQMTTECLDHGLSSAANATGKRVMSNVFKPSAMSTASVRLALALSMLLLASAYVAPFGFADEAAAQQAFKSPWAAARALAEAGKANDMKVLSSILGPDSDQVLTSGDPVADNNAREQFASSYDEMHRLAYDDEGRVILYIGAGNWPFPIPLVKKDSGWVFDTAAGKQELLYRRIGRNELFTLDVLDDLSDAQTEYASAAHDGENTGLFAQKILSDDGQQNGLYWAVAEGQPESPIGPLVAKATGEGYKRGSEGNPVPFHGYYYRVLTRQGPNAPGGAKNYIVDGKMSNGFAFLAYPADYRASGVMTFMINQDGVIVQKDLGADTAKFAGEITEYNPDKTWQEVDDLIVFAMPMGFNRQPVGPSRAQRQLLIDG